MNKRNIIHKIYSFYKNWVIPPHNETLLEVKRKEFKEKTKYLDMKTLYNLSDQEKIDLRLQGYFVDLSEKTLKDIHKFNISYNRHETRYLIASRNYNYDIIKDSYYQDQYYFHYQSDPEFNAKIYRPRIRVKRHLLNFSAFMIVAYINYYISSVIIVRMRNKTIQEQRFLEK